MARPDRPQNPPGGDARDPVDLLTGRARVRHVIELQDFLQRVGARRAVAFDEREVVERQVGDQPPVSGAAHRKPQAGSRFAETADRAENTRAFEMKVSLGISERQSPGKIAVAARRADRQGVGLGSLLTERKVDERQIDLRSLVVLALRGASRHVPEGFSSLAFPRMPDRVERLVRSGLLVLRARGRHLVHGVDLHRRLPADVGDHAVFALELRQTDRLRHLLEQVRHGRAVEAERLRVDPALHRKLPIEEQQNVDLGSEIGPGGAFETEEIEEEILLRKGEVLPEQPIAEERPVVRRKQALVRTESHGRDRRGRKRKAGSRIPSRRAYGDLRHGGKEMLVERVYEFSVALQVETQAVERALRGIERPLLQAREG